MLPYRKRWPRKKYTPVHGGISRDECNDSLGYIFDNARIQGQIRGFLIPGEGEVINNHFADNSLLSIQVSQGHVEKN